MRNNLEDIILAIPQIEKRLNELKDKEAPTYTIKKGDSLWNIAKANNISLDELRNMNPSIKNTDVIFPGDKLNLGYAYETKLVNLREEELRENEANKSNIGAIQAYKHDSNYAIVDKDNGLSVYDKNNNLLYHTNEISTGVSGNDYNTVTYQGGSSIENYAGNNSTPAGITRITSTGIYHGAPSFTRGRVNNENKVGKVKAWKKDENGNWYQSDELVDDNIASSIHIGNTTNKRSSNGCIRMSKRSLEELGKYLGVGDEVYTLPQQAGSRFTLKHGKLNFTADNPYGSTKKGNMSESGHDTVLWDDYNTKVDKSYTPLVIVQRHSSGNSDYDKTALAYANTISTNKEKLQKELNLTSYEYNTLARIAMGIAHNESRYGTSSRYKVKRNAPGFAIDAYQEFRALGKPGMAGAELGNSKGITQIKYTDDIKNKELKRLYDAYGVTEKTLETPQGAAIATMLRLAFVYNGEIKAANFKDAYGNKIPMDIALLYAYQGHKYMLKNGTATPASNGYISDIKSASSKFDFFEERKIRK